MVRVCICQECGAIFSTSGTVGRPPKTCNKCSKGRISICEVCKKSFRQKNDGSLICETCRPKNTTTHAKIVFINGCFIYETSGRCSEYFETGCIKCLDFCAKHDWIGWGKVELVRGREG